MMSISPEKLASATALRTISHAGKEKQPCIRMADLCRPGLQFAGYFDIFAFERPQVIGIIFEKRALAIGRPQGLPMEVPPRAMV